jgi:hypothetical protein
MSEAAQDATPQQKYAMFDIFKKQIALATTPHALRRVIRRIDNCYDFAEMHEYSAELVTEFARLAEVAESRLLEMEQEE